MIRSEGKIQGVVHPPDAQVADGVDPLAHDLRGEDDDQAVGQVFLQKRGGHGGAPLDEEGRDLPFSEQRQEFTQIDASRRVLTDLHDLDSLLLQKPPPFCRGVAGRGRDRPLSIRKNGCIRRKTQTGIDDDPERDPGPGPGGR